MLGYWNNPAETAHVIKEGWLRTGDMAFKDEEGDLFIVGRRKDFLKVGAHRVSPLEIENVVSDYEGVMEAAVIGAPEPVLGESVKCFITTNPGKKIETEDLEKFCKKRLPLYKVPADIIFLESMPRNNLGKIDKQALKLGLFHIL